MEYTKIELLTLSTSTTGTSSDPPSQYHHHHVPYHGLTLGIIIKSYNGTCTSFNAHITFDYMFILNSMLYNSGVY